MWRELDFNNMFEDLDEVFVPFLRSLGTQGEAVLMEYEGYVRYIKFSVQRISTNINSQNLLHWINYSVSASDQAEEKRKEQERLVVLQKEEKKLEKKGNNKTSKKTSKKNIKSEIPLFFGDQEAIIDDILYTCHSNKINRK